MSQILLTTNNNKFNIFPINLKNININITDVDTIFILNVYSHTLYYGKIKRVDELDDYNSTQYNNRIHTHSSVYSLEFHTLEPIPISALQDLYAYRKKGKLGNPEHSIFNSIKKMNFRYAKPVMDVDSFNKRLRSENYLNEEVHNKNILRELVLYEDKILPTEENFNITYGRVIQEDDHYLVTLTNRKMIELDIHFLSDSSIGRYRSYRPYFYEFRVDKSLNKKIRNYITSEEINGYYKVKLSEGEPKKYTDNLFSGEIIFSASPTIRQKAFLEFIEPVAENNIKESIRSLKDTFYSKLQSHNFSNSISITEEFEEAVNTAGKQDINFKIRIYKVGQANWIKVTVFNDDIKLTDIVFDIGKGHVKSNEIINNAQNAACCLKGEYLFVLSHWDMDHIEGVSDLEFDQYKKKWFVPNIMRNSSNAAFRLAAVLMIHDDIQSVFISERCNGSLLVDNNYFMLGKGFGRGSGVNVPIQGQTYKTKYTANNNLGLVIEIKGKNKNILLPGDCEYIQLPSAFRKQYSHIIMTHHGAVTKLNSDILLSSRNYSSKAIACVGPNKNYPKKSHVTALETLGFDIIRNRNHPNPYTIFID